MDERDQRQPVPFAQTLAERARTRLQTITSHMVRSMPFEPEAVEDYLRLGDYVYMELKSNSRVYALACTYIAVHANIKSFRYSPTPMADQDSIEHKGAACMATIGLGMFPFQWRENSLYALHQQWGQPVGTGNGVEMFTNLVLFALADFPEVLGSFCQEIIAESERTQKGFVNVFEWHPSHQFWQARVVCPARPLHSVVLSQDVKARLLEDVEEFVGQEARQWYKQHGIQHKRGYLFFGPPGTGKTSLIQALAAYLEYNICFLHLSHPALTDESLRAAMNQTPRRSLVVFEDIDAIFSRSREKMLSDSVLTFSGLLNTLDGVGKADGQIYILTTNHRERLNPALVRNGRVDVHIEFTYATDEQISEMFKRFFPFSSPRMPIQFVDKLRAVLDGRSVTPAALQHFFITQRKKSAADAIECAHEVVDEIVLREDEQLLMEEDFARKRSESTAKQAQRDRKRA